ncbi:MAG: nucleoside deaminase [Acidimicrobiales bacterium]|nr:nucleoside deaminase [Acidimicrobiales bacterium]
MMERAIREARLSLEHDDVPVGALILDKNNEVISSGHNEKEFRKDPTSHGEILAIRAASEICDSWHLEGMTLISTLEPCAMCAGAIVASRMKRLVFGAYDLKAGACGSLMNVVSDSRLNHQVETVGGVLETECSMTLKEFFLKKRK